MPFHRYGPVEQRVHVPAFERTWPTRRLTHAPLWVPVDLRDGNQALAEPMGPDRKRTMLDLLLRVGFKEIEIGYPSASQADFDFVRMLVEEDLIPDDVTVVAFTPARPDLIARTFEAIEGMTNVVVHMYTATAPIWRDRVLRHSRESLLDLILAGGEAVLRGARDRKGIRFQFSPEVFNQTEPDYILEVCRRMTDLWDASPERPVILNLPATVEIATPNVYADQIEYMHRNLDRRESVILSIHPHNDRGTGVACAELAMLAGAERIEGCLFGNGERTGNVDLVTLALNLYAEGIDPQLDFSDIDAIQRTVEACNRIGIHERHPYAGELVYTAFSGTHQDAIRKGFAHHETRAAELGIAASQAPWDIPYLPIDPADVGRDYEAVIRVNSQSGKGGIAWIVEQELGLELPRALQIDFSRVVQATTDATGEEIAAAQLRDLFLKTYVNPEGPITLEEWSLQAAFGEDHLVATLCIDGERITATGVENGPVSALTEILRTHGIALDIEQLTQQSLTHGRDSKAATFIEGRIGDESGWGIGIDSSVLTASLQAVIAAANRILACTATRNRA
jgi:2-isopropylmalate synthase